MKHMRSLSGKKVAVVGVGLSGIAAARLLAQQKAIITMTDDKPEKELETEKKSLGKIASAYRFGGIDQALLLESDMVVLSPGVPSDLPQLQRAREENIPIISEIELAYWFCDVPILAITGTNGKTTTTSLVHHMVKRAGLKARLGGNIQIPFSQVVNQKPIDAMVLEVSSFQLENIQDFSPFVGVLLNITPDHLNRYRSMEEYAAAKMALFRNQSEGDFAVLNRDDETVVRAAEDVRSKALWFSSRKEVEQGAFLRGTRVVVRYEEREKEIMDISQIPLLGRHNVENALAAAAAVLPLELPWEGYARAIKNFKGVEHRLERVREKDGVLFVNDSKATNIDALVKALESFDRPVVLIAGGRGKKSSYLVLRPLFEKKVRAMVTLGEDAPLLEEALGDLVSTTRANTLPEAVQTAASIAQTGDCVLLAPACASFDMFRNYEHRGQVFKEAVSKL
jgi:UDP-N-acetylmuramoylalanine--D-glutamate ligase